MALVLHLLMLFLLSGGLAKVVTDFEHECGQFFANKKSPTRFSGSQYKQICQTLNNRYYYATYYDTDNRIPVYSAYRFNKIMGCTRRNNWYIEPQLDVQNTAPDISSEGSVKDKKLRGVHQALNADYENSGYHRGHLAPVYQAESQSCADATFTLTNAAPQVPNFNSPVWRDEEKKMAKLLESQCIGQPVYIVTGVVPGPGNINNRVNVPSHFWSAYCCLDQNNRCSKSEGVIGKNEKTSKISNKTVDNLEKDLTTFYQTNFKLFQ